MNIHRSSLSVGTPEWLARATARRQLKFFQPKSEFVSRSWRAFGIEKSLPPVGRGRGDRDRNRERRGKTKKRRRLFASARRAWPAAAAEVVKRLVLTTSANCLGPRSKNVEGCQERRCNSVKPTGCKRVECLHASVRMDWVACAVGVMGVA